jgi:hypothetical protein
VGISEVRFALPQRSPSPLSVPCTCRAPGLDGRKAARDGGFGVVMGVDAQPVARDARRDDLAGDAPDLPGQRAAIGVAKHDPARAGVQRGAQAGERVVGLAL